MNEIEITEEMVDAGFEVLRTSGLADEYSKADRYTVAAIFHAMYRRRKSQAEPQTLST
jgi:hypothetical protein